MALKVRYQYGFSQKDIQEVQRNETSYNGDECRTYKK